MNAETLIQIGEKTVKVSSVALPSTGRLLRNAWTLNGAVIEVDMAVAKELRINQLLDEASKMAEAARRKQRVYAAKGDEAAAAAEAAKVARFNGVPATPARIALNSATTPEALMAITVEDFFP